MLAGTRSVAVHSGGRSDSAIANRLPDAGGGAAAGLAPACACACAAVRLSRSVAAARRAVRGRQAAARHVEPDMSSQSRVGSSARL